ncbi:hypothetical protein VB618_09805 [Microvirga sp. CF3062]|uniref:hypothetical protein n=1 Tax=Microvirga sp. CF3062 TaxID=3110182 RepID=UPI002E76F1EE|nr:hypothetical protein [Microvirga sp. CF3062]MEE1656492.1 hypothetical protein [Microvirga sp. CF3062]
MSSSEKPHNSNLPGRKYTRVKIPNLSDTELRERSFRIPDPLLLPNLIERQHPPLDQELTYEGNYEVGTKLPCAFGHPHKKGYVFCDEGGQRYLIGHQCGASHFGLGDWAVFTKGLKQLEDKASYLRNIKTLREILSQHREWIAGLERHKAFKAFDQLRQELRWRYPQLVTACDQVFHRADGQLTLKGRMRDIQAEIRRDEREEVEAERQGRPARKFDSPMFKPISIDGGRLVGKALFINRAPVVSMVRDTVRNIDTFLASDKIITQVGHLIAVSRNARQLVTNLAEARYSVAEAVAFFQQDNLELFARWANEGAFDRKSFKAEVGRVRISDEVSNPYVLSRPDALEPIEDERFDEIQAAVVSFDSQFKGARKGQKR